MKWLIGITFCAVLASCAKIDKCETTGQPVEWYGVLTWSTSDPFSDIGGFFLRTNRRSQIKADYTYLYKSESVYTARIKADSMAEHLLNEQMPAKGSIDIRGKWTGLNGSISESCALPGTSGKFFEASSVSDWSVVK